MEGRMKKYRQVSPERAKVWTEKSRKYHQQLLDHPRKVPVVYYLCRNQQLEHPHFMEVPLSSSEGLYLRDVIERLNVLRGRGIASKYSWSCKRNYKNGFVWHDLCDDDIIYPAHGNDYILKGSELFQESDPGSFNPAGTFITQTQKAVPESPSSSSSSSNGRATKGSDQDEELSPPPQLPSSSPMSPESILLRNSCLNVSLNSTENKVDKGDCVVDSQNTCTRGVSTDDDLSEPIENQVSRVKQTLGTCEGGVPPPPSTSAAPSVSGRIDTLESLIRADIRKLRSFKILEEEGFRISSSMKLKVANTIMQLVSCGLISVKDHKFPSLSSTSSSGMRLNNKQCFSERTADTSILHSSCAADSCGNDKESVMKIEERLSSGARIIIQSHSSDNREVGVAHLWRICISWTHSKCIVCPHGRTVMFFIESNKNCNEKTRRQL